jgi:hypothetical protein
MAQTYGKREVLGLDAMERRRRQVEGRSGWIHQARYRVGYLASQKQIPRGNDSKKSKGEKQVFAALRMTNQYLRMASLEG